MTEEYKENVLKYLTNHLLQQNGTQEPKYDNIDSSASDLYTNIRTNYSGMIVPIGFVQAQDNINNYSVFAINGTLIGESDSTGAFVLLDKDYNIVDLITEYNDGTKIGRIQCINVDEKGNFYMVEQVGANYQIVLLNNITLKPVKSNTYKAIKISTYTIPSQYTWTAFCKIFKNQNSDKFFAVAERSEGIVGIHLEIKDTNTWTYYTSTYTTQSSYKMFENGFNIYWDTDGSVQFQIASYDDGLIMLSKGAGTTMTATRYTNNVIEAANANLQNYDFIFYSNNLGYLLEVIHIERTGMIPSGHVFEYTITKVNLENKTATKIYEGDEAKYLTRANCWIWLLKRNNILCFYEYFNSSNDNYKAYFSVIDGDIVYTPQQIGTFTESVWLYAWLYPNIIVDFNKVYVYFVNNSSLIQIEMTWNPDNYSGLPYESSTSLIPRFATIEDENEVELYNRNLYNLTIYSNGYNATLQVPNTYLNGLELTNTQLYSQNNNLLVGNTISVQKNVYEELYINFINRFNVLNNGLLNIEASNGLVNAMLNKIATGHLGKIQINYQDETSEIKSLTMQDLVYTYLDTGVKTTLKLMVYTSKLIDSIELLSADETISYSTIDCSNLELNKYYLITQDVRIE